MAQPVIVREALAWTLGVGLAFAIVVVVIAGIASW